LPGTRQLTISFTSISISSPASSSAAVGRYKGRPVDARAVAKDLNVKAVLVGKVGQHSDTLSISVEMIDGRDNHQIWGNIGEGGDE
jgi:TolB-like protein